MNKLFLFGVIFLLFSSIVAAVDFTPSGDINNRNVYNIKNVPNIFNVTNVNATHFKGEGGQITNVTASSVSWSNITSKPFSSVNQTQFDNSSGTLNIVLSWLHGLFYYNTEVYNKTEMDSQQLAQNNTIATKLVDVTGSNVYIFVNGSQTNKTVNFNETKLNSTIVSTASIYNDTVAINNVDARVTSVNSTVATHTSQIAGLVSSNTTTNSRIDSVNSSLANYVTLGTSQTITGDKAFTGTIIIYNSTQTNYNTSLIQKDGLGNVVFNVSSGVMSKVGAITSNGKILTNVSGLGVEIGTVSTGSYIGFHSRIGASGNGNILFNDGTGQSLLISESASDVYSIGSGSAGGVVTPTVSFNINTKATTFAGDIYTIGNINELSQGVAKTGIHIDGNRLQVGSGVNADGTEMSVNYLGYNYAGTRFRNLQIYDGKGASIINVIGSTKTVAFARNVSIGGNVGIGTTSPSETLDIERSSDTEAGGFRLANTLQGGYGNALRFYSTQQVFNTSTVEAARIAVVGENNWASAGTVDSYMTLHVVHGNVLEEKMRILSNGNVGIGTTAPLTKLHIDQGVLTMSSINTANTYAARANAIAFTQDGQPIGDYTHYISYSTSGTQASNTLNFELSDGTSTGHKNVMTMIGNGNVGIGTTTPSEKLSIYGQLLVQPRMPDSDSAGFRVGGSFTNPSFISNDFPLYLQTGGGNQPLILDVARIGIGTQNPQGTLDISGTAVTGATRLVLTSTDSANANSAIVWKNNSGVTQSIIGSNYNIGDAGNLEFATGGTSTKMIIQSNGNVGIGTTTPGAKLVIGDGLTAGTLMMILNSPANSWAGIAVQKAGVEKWYIGMGSTGIYGDTLIFRRASSSNDMVIDSTGNVGIGTITPGSKLSVVGNVSVSVGGSANHAMCWKADGKTLGYCSDIVSVTGTCTCN